MTNILGCQPFTKKNMAEMTSATGTRDFGPPTVGIGRTPDGARDLVIETGPSATGVEFVRRTVQRRTALPAYIGSGGFMFVETPRKKSFGTLFEDHVFFLSIQRFHGSVLRECPDGSQEQCHKGY